MNGKNIFKLNLIILGYLLFAALLGITCAYIHENFGLGWAMFALVIFIVVIVNVIGLIATKEEVQK